MQEGERIPAGWVELIYSVRQPQPRSLAFTVLVDGEDVHTSDGNEETSPFTPRRYPSVSMGRITVWMSGEGEQTLTLLQHPDNEEDIRTEEIQRMGMCGQINGAAVNAQAQAGEIGLEEQELSVEEWSHGSVRLSPLSVIIMHTLHAVVVGGCSV